MLCFVSVPPLPHRRRIGPGVRKEALQTLVDLVRLDTSQPEGNEILAARYLKEKLDREGIPSQILESAPGRANIVARVKGKRLEAAVVAAWSSRRGGG